MNKREIRKFVKRNRIGFYEGLKDYANWLRNPGAPMPFGSTLSATLPGCSTECRCPITEQAWWEGWAYGEERGVPRWL